MKFSIFLILLINLFTISHAQQTPTDTSNFILINNEKGITNDMIFEGPWAYKKNKKPTYFINGKEVFTLTAYYNHDEFKKITVLQATEAVKLYGKKGKNGVVLVELKDDVKGPVLEIPSNRIYYTCEVDGKKVDTSAAYYNAVNGKRCSILDLRDSLEQPVFYIGFDNLIRIKHLGAGWDVVTIFISGGIMSGTWSDRIVRVQKEGTARIGITVDGKLTEMFVKVRQLPPPRP